MTTKVTTNRFSPEVRERAAQTLHDWTRKAEVDAGKRAGVPSEVAEELKALEREDREWRQANEVPCRASACSAQSELGPLRVAFQRSFGSPEPCASLRPFKR